MASLHQTATVDSSGRLVPDSPGAWAADIQKLKGKRVSVTIDSEKKPKTLKQLGYYRGVIIPFFLELWSRERRYPNGLPPYLPEQVHETLVKVTIGYEEEDGPMGVPVRKKTAKSDTIEMNQLIDGSRQLAWDEYQVRLPEPNEPWDAIGGE
jgi:hypothetical protein